MDIHYWSYGVMVGGGVSKPLEFFGVSHNLRECLAGTPLNLGRTCVRVRTRVCGDTCVCVRVWRLSTRRTATQ